MPADALAEVRGEGDDEGEGLAGEGEVLGGDMLEAGDAGGAGSASMRGEERELKARRTSRREVEIWGVKEGREEVRDRSVLRVGSRVVALATRMKRFWSMMAGLV